MSMVSRCVAAGDLAHSLSYLDLVKTSGALMTEERDFWQSRMAQGERGVVGG